MKALLLLLVLLSTLSFGQNLPKVVDNSQWFPPVRSQEVLPNCTQFSLIYYLKSAVWNKKLDRDPKLEVNQFNHNFVWNQTIHPVDKKSNAESGFEFMKNQGCATMADFPANEQSSDIQPSRDVKEKALFFKSSRLFKTEFNSCDGVYSSINTRLLSLKDSLVQGKCFTINILIFDSFFKMSGSRNVYSCYGNISLDSIKPSHVVTVVGYNDTIKTAKGRGAFRVVDSGSVAVGGYFYLDYNWLYFAQSDYTCYFLEEDFSSQPKIVANIKFSGGISGVDVFDHNYVFVDTLLNYSGKNVDFKDFVSYLWNQNQIQVININGKRIKMRSKIVIKPLNNLDGNYELISDLSDLSSAADFKSASVVIFDPISANYVGADGQSFYSYTRESKLVINQAYLSFVGTTQKIIAKIKDLPDTTIVSNDFYSVVAGLNLKPFQENIYVKSCTSTLKRKLITYSIADVKSDTPPVFSNPIAKNVSIYRGSIMMYQFRANDEENSPLVYSITSGSGATILPNIGSFNFPAFTVGDFPFTITASDGFFSVSQSFVITVKENTAPVFGNFPYPLKAYVGQEFTYQFEATDKEGQKLTFSLAHSLAEAQMSSDGLLTFKSSKTGTFQFTIIVSDGLLATTAGVRVWVDIYDVVETVIAPEYAISIYPNPVSANTSIELLMPKSGLVTLTIYDLQGRQVEVITRNEYEVGKNTITYDASNLRSGTYVCRFITADFSKSIKIIKQ